MRVKAVHRLNVEHLSGHALRYPAKGGSRWAGRRVPDRPLAAAPEGGPDRLYELFRDGHFVLLGPDRPDDSVPSATPWSARLRTGVLAEPIIGWPPYVLIRPDGYVAWAGRTPDAGLDGALRRWCGEPERVAG